VCDDLRKYLSAEDMWETSFVAGKTFSTPRGCNTRSCSAPLVQVRPSLTAALYSSRPQKESTQFNNVGKPRKKNKAAIFCLSLLCAATILVGNFDGSNFSEAEASELNVKDDPQTSSLWTPNFSSSSSDQLLKSLSAHQNTKSTTQSPKYKQRYWDAIASGNPDDVKFVNEKLIDNAVSTIATMYYDSSGGFDFDPQQFYAQWKASRSSSKEKKIDLAGFPALGENPFGTRDNTVKALKSIVASLNDPYSKYLTRDELKNELIAGDGSFLGLGALVETPSLTSMSQLPAFSIPKREKTDLSLDKISKRNWYGQYEGLLQRSTQNEVSKFRTTKKINEELLSVAQAENLPVVTAIVPDSPAERAGIVVGDRIALVGEFNFMGMSRAQVKKALEHKFHAENYFGTADLTIAKQIMARSTSTVAVNYGADGNAMDEKYVFEDGWYRPRRRSVLDDMQIQPVIGYKMSHVSIPTTLTAGSALKLESLTSSSQVKYPAVFGGDSIVHYELLTPDDSIFQQLMPDSPSAKVGYIRLTRFSRASTAGYIEAVKALEDAGTQSYIIDLRNNYGGVIQEAMLTASTLLRDPHVVLCYTLNSRGGFKPQENMEYVVDKSYPGYLLSSEESTVSSDQVKREHPEYFEDGGWTSPTSYASLRELRMTRGIKPAVRTTTNINSSDDFQPVALNGVQKKKELNLDELANVMSRNSQKKLVLLINEGTGKKKLYD
jgi:C-terminal processing protease CtpA/Prc